MSQAGKLPGQNCPFAPFWVQLSGRRRPGLPMRCPSAAPRGRLKAASRRRGIQDPNNWAEYDAGPSVLRAPALLGLGNLGSRGCVSAGIPEQQVADVRAVRARRQAEEAPEPLM